MSARRLRSLAFVLCITVSACTAQGDRYTLYRDSAVNHSLRIHVASFDAAAGIDYNCDAARGLFQAQLWRYHQVLVRKGYFQEVANGGAGRHRPACQRVRWNPVGRS
ncbi:hypothetical protein RCH10_005382 [Variovorax sp. GrIS 2.14]|uniref:hypothetical protein n=1 Tax=Variovorax sp. GrIS 2.14 TaxID=3071709 RepID=UPI0038F60B08